jgi:hypothetical protein
VWQMLFSSSKHIVEATTVETADVESLTKEKQ